MHISNKAMEKYERMSLFCPTSIFFDAVARMTFAYISEICAVCTRERDALSIAEQLRKYRENTSKRLRRISNYIGKELLNIGRRYFIVSLMHVARYSTEDLSNTADSKLMYNIFKQPAGLVVFVDYYGTAYDENMLAKLSVLHEKRRDKIQGPIYNNENDVLRDTSIIIEKEWLKYINNDNN